MKFQIHQSKVDTADDTEAFGLIGWGPKAPMRLGNTAAVVL